MTKQTVKGFMFMEFESDWAHGDYDQKWWPRWKEFKPSDSAERVFIGEMSVEFDVPDDFDPIPKQVAALEAEKREALAEYQSKVASINERLSKLQAITYDPEAV
jgi:hypothetical protein